jgi:hypothetical protein
MKNIQIIDDAVNCSYSIYSIPDDAFQMLFPKPGQDIEFLEDAIDRLGQKSVGDIMKFTWTSRLPKASVRGIHGTLFVGMLERKRFYPHKTEADMDDGEFQKKLNHRRRRR